MAESCHGLNNLPKERSVLCYEQTLVDKLVPSHTSFLTAAGKIEKPMSILPRLPITIGSLTLHNVYMVTKQLQCAYRQ